MRLCSCPNFPPEQWFLGRSSAGTFGILMADSEIPDSSFSELHVHTLEDWHKLVAYCPLLQRSQPLDHRSRWQMIDQSHVLEERIPQSGQLSSHLANLAEGRQNLPPYDGLLYVRTILHGLPAEWRHSLAHELKSIFARRIRPANSTYPAQIPVDHLKVKHPPSNLHDLENRIVSSPVQKPLATWVEEPH